MRQPSRPSALALALLVLAGSATGAMAGTPEEEALADAVKGAIAAKDAGALERLTYCEGATASGKEFSLLLLETAMEIDVVEVVVGPLPEGKTGPPTTLPVTHLLRITGAPGEGPSRQMFPVGEKDGRLLIACAMEAPRGMQ